MEGLHNNTPCGHVALAEGHSWWVLTNLNVRIAVVYIHTTQHSLTYTHTCQHIPHTHHTYCCHTTLIHNQGVTLSRTKPLIFPSGHFPHTTNTSAIGEFVIHDLVPFRVYVRDTSLNTALVSIEPGSLPWSGSVSPKQPMSSPLAKQEEVGL